MLTLENVGLNDEGIIVLDFSYQHENVEFDGRIKLTKDDFIEAHKNGDELLEEFVQDTLFHELVYLLSEDN